jgi:2-dehydropantoate 2-reductase
MPDMADQSSQGSSDTTSTGAASVAVVGPGAIGGALAGAFAEADPTNLVICGRSRFDRLVVSHPDGVVDVPVRTVTEPTGLEPVDLLVLAVKAHQTEGAQHWLPPLIGPDTVVVIAQNGVEHLSRVAPLVPEGTTLLPAVVWCPAERSAPGRIEVTGNGYLNVPKSPEADRLAARLDGTFFGIRPTSNWQSRAWDKLMMNAALGGLGVLTGRSGRDICQDPTLADLLLQLMEEAASVARAEGADMPPDRPEKMVAAMAGGSGHVSSIVVDRLAGRPTEWDARNAVIGRLAEKHGIDVPLNRWVTALVRMGEPNEGGAAGA